MILSRYFNKALSFTKITPGLKENYKNLDLFEALNDFYLEQERNVNYYHPDDSSWCHFTESDDKLIKNKARSSK